MKNYNKLFLLMMVLGFFIFLGNVEAEEDNTCNSVSFSELRTMASNVKVTYVPVTEKDESYVDPVMGVKGIDREYLDVKVYNITSKLYIKASATGSNVTPFEKILTLNDVGPDGSATLRQAAQSETITYEFKIFSDYYGCSNKILRTFKVTLPRFNFYSTLDICKDIPEYYLCQSYTTYKVDGTTFYDKVDEYKAKLLEDGDKSGGASGNTGVVSETITKVSKYKYVIVGIIVGIGALVTIFILKKKRSV